MKRLSVFRNWYKQHVRLSLSEQFLLISFGVLLSGMLIIGWWVASQIENAVVSQTANVTSLYMKSFVAPLLQPLVTHDTLDSTQHQQLQHLIMSTPLGQDVVAMKVWAPDGTILFSLQPSIIGSKFPIDGDPDLKQALTGQTVSHLSTLDRPENSSEREFGTRLLETYVPVYAVGTDQIIAVAEFYQYSVQLIDQITSAQQQTWVVVAIATILMYSLMSGLVGSGSRLIDEQQTQLQQSVKDLAALLEENRALHVRLQQAAARAAEVDEQFLHRIGRDLHDGPAQDLALVLLRLDDVSKMDPSQLETLRHALTSALHEIRTLAAGLQLPELEALSTLEVARRAVREFQHKTGSSVEFEASDTLPVLSLSKKIAIYRVIAEALHNSYLHAKAKNLRVQLSVIDQSLRVVISDSGPGFDPSALESGSEHLGIAGLQQRIALLDGSFEIQSSKDEGTRIQVCLPLKEGWNA